MDIQYLWLNSNCRKLKEKEGVYVIWHWYCLINIIAGDR